MEAAARKTHMIHPLHQIATSPTHRLLLKQWLKESDLIGRRTTVKQAQMSNLQSSTTFLLCFFFLFHSTFILLLFQSPSPLSCRHSWIPCLLSLLSSMAVAWAVRYKTDAERHLRKLMEREMEDGVLLGKCVDELKRNGTEFDLLKEVDALRRAKTLSVGGGGEAEETGRWKRDDVAMTILFPASCAFLVLTRSVACLQHSGSI